MVSSLLFIPDISGFTEFVQSTEVEHSQHVIAELLEVLIEANTLGLQLVEIEGDALFFYRETCPSQEQLLAQIEAMYTSFYSHLKLLDTHRICPCKACTSAPKLELKIIVHTGAVQFLEVQGTQKPFGEAVIEVHRLLKNSVSSSNYILLSDVLVDAISLSKSYSSNLYTFKEGKDTYDTKQINYLYAEIDVAVLQLNPYSNAKKVSFSRPPNITMSKNFDYPAKTVLEIVSNYKYRSQWAPDVDKFIYDENQVTRSGTPHTCVINGKHFGFTAVTMENKPGTYVYGEQTTDTPFVTYLYQFYIIKPTSETSCTLDVEIYWKTTSFFKKIALNVLVKPKFIANTNKALTGLSTFLKRK